jgi:hypothetical protein
VLKKHRPTVVTNYTRVHKLKSSRNSINFPYANNFMLLYVVTQVLRWHVVSYEDHFSQPAMIVKDYGD